MNTPRYDLASSRQSSGWTNRLWIVAAALGLLTAVHLFGVAHDGRSWRASLRATAQAVAEQHAERLTERLQFLATETFAPVSGFGTVATRSAVADLAQLAAMQSANESCGCKTVLPVAEFFRVDLDIDASAPMSGVQKAVNATNDNNGTFQITRRVSGGAASTATPLTDEALTGIAQAQFMRRDSSGVRMVSTIFDAAHTDFAVTTTVRSDSVGRPVVLYGFIAPAHALMQTLLSLPMVHSAAGRSRAGAIPDTQSLQIGITDSLPVYGRVSDDRPYRGSVLLHGPLDGLGLTVALSSAEARVGQVAQPTDRLWALGLLSVATVLVIIIAVSTSRREMFLARARSDFIAGTSHDFRMPLAQILLASETLNLRPEVSSEERAQLGKAIVRETHRLIAMVENVLLFSRSGAVEIKPTLHLLKTREVFDDVSESVRLAAEDARQTISVDVPNDLQVKADRQLLRQALVNLVDNAMKYGAPNQTITLGARANSAGEVLLSVSDQGTGIPEGQREQIFQPYERLARDQTSERAGSGLGLAVVSQIVRAFRGRVWVESAPGGGARFVIALTGEGS